MEKHERISGIFSTQEVRKIGTGTTAHRSVHKSFWSCAQIEQGEEAGKIEIQPLNSNYIPSGPKRVMDLEQFLADFSPEPEFYISTVFPRMREMNKTIARAERHRDNKEYYTAEMEFNNALKVDEENVRANFGLGLTYLERNDAKKAQDIFSRLVKLDAAFEQEHKHLFNEFGIQLRKNKMFKEALDYYNKALSLTDSDENLYYNAARAAMENGDIEQSAELLLKGLELNPFMDEGIRFLMWMISKQLLPASRKQAAAQVLQKVKAAKSAQDVPPEQVAGPGQAQPGQAQPGQAQSGQAQSGQAQSGQAQSGRPGGGGGAASGS